MSRKGCAALVLAAAVVALAPGAAVAAPKTIKLRPGKTDLRLDPRQDYVLQLPRTRPLVAAGGLRIFGGRDVTMVGGTVHVPDAAAAALLHDQTGTIRIEGVRFTGRRLREGIDLWQTRGAVVQLVNISVATVHGSYATNHADLLQTWAGPRRLVVNGFEGSTEYQGFFLLPNQLYDGPAPELFDLRNVFIRAPRGAYVLWRSSHASYPLRVHDVWVQPNRRRGGPNTWLWPRPSTGNTSWHGVHVGTPPRNELRRLRSAGLHYRPR
jgi:hypothetical protein